MEDIVAIVTKLLAERDTSVKSLPHSESQPSCHVSHLTPPSQKWPPSSS